MFSKWLFLSTVRLHILAVQVHGVIWGDFTSTSGHLKLTMICNSRIEIRSLPAGKLTLLEYLYYTQSEPDCGVHNLISRYSGTKVQLC
jgi:hypothetical protein